MTAILELRNVSKTYGGGLIRRRSTVALRDCWLAIGGDRPTILSIAGESGSGKTTMGMLMLGFVTPSAGQVLYKGQDLWQAPKELWKDYRREVQAIFQDPFEVYNPFYKVDHVMTVPLSKFGLAKSKEKRRAMMEEALEKVGLRPEETLGRHPHQLSGGQRQRIAVARALMLQPRVIIADEPVSMVDASLRATILKSLRALKEDMGISIAYITHDLATAYHISEDILILYQGAVVEAGDVDSVITSPEHPYTQLLVGSIAWPDPHRKWGEAERVGKARTERVTEGCSFAPRCPKVMDICLRQHPRMHRTKDSRAVACFLYQGASVIEAERIGEVLGVAASSTRRRT